MKIDFFAKSKSVKILLFALIIRASLFAQKPLIIEFGWDRPTVGFLSKNLDSMQGSPFDGIAFCLQKEIADVLDTNLYIQNSFEYEKLKSLKWGKYKSNFIIVRAQGKNGPAWFDDEAWVNRLKNANGLSKALMYSKVKGILLDAEYYGDNPINNPWTYSAAQYPDNTFEEVQDQVRKRGEQFIKALQKSTSNFTILSIWITSLILDDQKVKPYEKARHALLPCFFEGILLAKSNGVKIIDGNELAYWNTKPSEFIESPKIIQETTVRLMKTDKGKKLAKSITISQPVFYDGLLVRHPSYNLGSDTSARWGWLQESLKNAIATSTSNIVWFYNQRVDWWSGKVNDTLVSILENCRTGFVPGKKGTLQKALVASAPNINSGKGYFYSTDKIKPMQTSGIAFLYTLNSKSKKLLIEYPGRQPLSIAVFVNGKLALLKKGEAASASVSLAAFKKGRVAILAKYNDKSEACAFFDY